MKDRGFLASLSVVYNLPFYPSIYAPDGEITLFNKMPAMQVARAI
jgi:hypothetical protein